MASLHHGGRPRVWLGLSFRLVCLAAWLAVGASCGQAPRGSGQTEAAAPSSPEAVVQSPQGSHFDDPDVIVREFAEKLGELADKSTLVAPADLAKQADEATTCLTPTLPDPGVALTPEEIYQRARRSVVIVGGVPAKRKPREWHATCAGGFFVHRDGILVTNFHVVQALKDLKTVGVMTDDRRVLAIEAVLAGDKHNDVAVLKIAGKNHPALPIATDVPVGAAVYCISHPSLVSHRMENGFYTFTQGIVSGKFRLRMMGDPPVDSLTVTADYGKGSSGSPILNQRGAVVGIVCQTMPLYHDLHDMDVQMVWKYSRPVSAILRLLGKRS